MTIINVNSISGINSITAQGASGIEFYDSSGNSVHTVTSDTLTVGTGASVHNPASNVLTLGTNNEERLRITSDGHVGIGTDAYFARLHIEDFNGELIRAEMTTDTASGRITCIGGTASYAGINFGDRDDIDAGRIRYYNDENSGAYAHMLFYTNNAESMRLTSDGVRLPSGKGINFSAYATSGNPSSNLLSDYEEGTWTAGMSFNGSTSGVIINNDDAFYIKVGRMVTCWGRLTLSNNGSGVGGARLTGLPFTVDDVVPTTGLDGGGFFCYQNNVTGTVYGSICILPEDGETTANLYGSTDTSGNMVGMTNTNISDSFDSRFVFSYVATT